MKSVSKPERPITDVAQEDGRDVASPLDVEGIALDLSTNEIIQLIAESRRYPTDGGTL